MKRISHMMTNRGFSLIELLIVLVIMGIVMVLAVPAFERGSRSSSLTSAGEMIVSHLALAQQTALTQNHPVEVRFYSTPQVGGSNSYRSFQLFKTDGTVLKPMTKVLNFSKPTAFIEAQDKTSFLTLPVQTSQGDPSAPRLPGVDGNYSYVRFKFKPTGETNLDPTLKWFVTLAPQRDPVKSNGLPANFLTIQIDPVSGKPTVIRP